MDSKRLRIRVESPRSGVSVMSVVFADGVDAPAGDLDGEAAAWWEAPEPAWVREAYTAALRDDLAAATTAPVGRGTLSLISLLDPEQLGATAASHPSYPYEDGSDFGFGDVVSGDAGHGDDIVRSAVDDGAHVSSPAAGMAARQAAGILLDGVVVAQRLINHVQAIQQKLMAAFCRPGVALPLSDLLDLAGNELGAALAAAADAVEDAVAGAAADTATNAARALETAPPTSVDTNERRGPRQPGQVDPIEMAARPEWTAVLRQTAVKAASAEIGCALRLAPVTARIRCETALELVDHYPATVAGQQAGDVDSYRARLVSESLAVLPRHLRSVVEGRVLPAAITGTTASLRRLIDREIIAADPAAAKARVERAKGDRIVVARRGENDSGIVTAIISAADAELASATLDAIADGLARSHPDDKRTHAQLRADAFTDLFRSLATTGHADITAGPSNDITAASHCPAARDSAAPGAAWCGAVLPTGAAGTVAAYRRPVALNVYIDAATLAKLDERPGELAGHGAITASTARALAASADTIRAIIVRPVGPDRACETVLDAGRAIYRPPDPTADHVTVRDRICTFPGCRAPAHRCDLDHRRPFDSGGDTCPHNLDALCRAHHRIKTFTAWRASSDPDTGRLTWVSPVGRHYPAEQAHLLHDGAPGPDRTTRTTAHGSALETAGDLDDPPPF